MENPMTNNSTDQSIATVREAAHALYTATSPPWCACTDSGKCLQHANEERMDAALDSLAAELERTQKIAEAHKGANKLLVDEYEAKLTAHVESLNAAEAELERVKAERDEIAPVFRFVLAEARLDKALSALREIAKMRSPIDNDEWTFRDVARAAIAEIEGINNETTV